QKAVGRYNQLLYLRRPLKQSFMLTLSLVLLLAVLFAAWAAFQWAQRLLEPIRELARGTRAVARGEYGERLAVSRLDDLGMLLQSFNEMTERLAEAREAAEASQRLVERQRAYLETLLENLSSGVVSLDPQGRLRTLNRAAAQILGVRAPERLIGRDIETLRRGNDTFALFIDQLAAQLHGADEECHIQLALQGKEGRKIVMCHGVRLPTGGQVIVFDDVTALIQAQRDAAWAEVARRLAHEIKNPLTPIQLSAERLRRKLLGKLGAEEARILDRATQTIVAQVEAMKSMVNAFGEYARQPRGEVGMVDVNQLVRDVAELYRANAAGARLELDLAPELPKVRADADRLRQVLHNLFNNALEALGERGDGWVRVVTRGSADGEAVEVEVSDNGPGIPEEMLERLFEPYVTSKSRGTGLGLAIVKKIVEEHGGTVWAENRPEGGARLVIRLPAAR
ncbi:MAG TPA: HAMP domain-containing protein, partial [Chromatiales bacterium]|nr:HAMP domain-containing protein [Chromatiales bacterium]